MAFLFRKKDVPSELPNLISDDINNDLKEELDNVKSLSEQRENLMKQSSVEPKKEANPSSVSISPDSEKPQTDGLKKFPSVKEDDEGYFKALIKSVMDETEDLDKMKNWHANKFISKDIVVQMREYWEKQTPELILNNFGGEAKAKLFQQIEKLHTLEKDWQNNYLNLLGCEDKIRDEEKQLKEALTEFIAVYKRTASRKHR